MRGLAVALVLVTTPAHALCKDHPFAHAGASVRALAKPTRLVTLAGAVVAPFVLAPTGGDHEVRVLTQKHGGRYDLEHVSLSVPYALVGALAVTSLSTTVFGDCEGARIGNALFQSVLVAALGSNVLKFLIGRGYPTGGGDPYAEDRLGDSSRATQVDGPGHFGAWPSGHAAVTFAFASALRTAAPRLGLFRFSGYVLATGVSLGMLFGDHHWASDVVSGALFGEAIGSSIGTGFSREKPGGVSFAPFPGGMSIAGSF